jgi:hypothetical protein
VSSHRLLFALRIRPSLQMQKHKQKQINKLPLRYNIPAFIFINSFAHKTQTHSCVAVALLYSTRPLSNFTFFPYVILISV